MTRFAWIGALAAALVAGCAGNGPAAEPAAEELAEAICDWSFRCCDAGETTYYLSPFVNAEDCAERLVSSGGLASTLDFDVPIGPDVVWPNLEALDRAIKDGRVRVNSSALRECRQHLEALECNSIEDDPLPDPDPVERCDPTLPEPLPTEGVPCIMTDIIEGKVGDGGRCSTDLNGLECKEGFVCLTVDSLGVDGACGPPQQLGEPCFSDQECAADLYCSFLDGTCQEPKQVDEPCQYADTAAPLPTTSMLLVECASGLTCSPFDQLCVGPCSRGFECNTDLDCAEGLVCVELPNTLGNWDGYCDMPRAEGEQCEETDDCQEGLSCEGTNIFDDEPGTCTPALANGVTCFFDDECRSGICSDVTNSCIDPLANGGECDRHVECQSQFCNWNSGVCEAMVAPGAECDAGTDDQCVDGWCDQAGFFSPGFCSVGTDCASGACDTTLSECYECDDNGDCDTGLCDTTAHECLNVCVALLADGAACTFDDDCASGVCVDGANICGTPPFADGEPCDDPDQCESEFCNFGATPPVCDTPPLANGEPCFSDSHCESLVCFEGACRPGAAEGADCGPGLLPCDPNLVFCDFEASNPQCTPFAETGEACTRNLECRSSFCLVKWGRTMCSAAAAPNAVVCDGT